VPIAESAVGTSMIDGITPVGLPSESTRSMNATSPLVRPSMPRAVSAPETKFLLPAPRTLKNAPTPFPSSTSARNRADLSADIADVDKEIAGADQNMESAGAKMKSAGSASASKD